ncbi:hypothetical protein NQD34_006871, partial [Periophthalmus magnuspinnatus]
RKRSMPQCSVVHPELAVNFSGVPPASPRSLHPAIPSPIAVWGHQRGVSVPICK